MKKLSSLFIIILITISGYSQDKHLVDSLQTILKTAKQDTNKAKILNRLASAYQGNNPDKAMEYAKQNLVLSEQIGFKKGIANAYNIMGGISEDKGDHLTALDLFKKSLKIRQEIGNKQGIAGSFNNVGLVYERIGNYPEALKYYFASLKIGEETQNKTCQAINYINIGNIYCDQGNYPEALKIFFCSLKISEEIGDKRRISSVYGNIGLVYLAQGNYPEALKNYRVSLQMQEEIGNKMGIAHSYSNIGLIYLDQGNYPEALKNFFAALKINEELGVKEGIVVEYNSIGNAYTKQKKFKDASDYLKKSLSLAKEIRSLGRVVDVYENLAKLDSAEGNYQQALEHYKLFITHRDSLVNKENTKKTVQQQMQYDFDKKEAITKAVQEKKDIVQRNIRYSILLGLAGALIFLVVVYRQRNKISKEKNRSEELLLNILPSEVAVELKQTGHCQPKTFSMVTVMFTDFKDFTRVSEKVSAELLVGEINYCFSAFDNILQKYKIEKIKTVGDAYMCASGLPALNYTHAFDVVSAGLEMKEFILNRKKEKEGKGEIAFEIRIGIHTGPVVAGIVGVKKFQYDIWGDTVNLAARMEQSCEPGNVNISGSTYELVKDAFNCKHRGKIEAKNKGMIDMYFVDKIS